VILLHFHAVRKDGQKEVAGEREVPGIPGPLNKIRNPGGERRENEREKDLQDLSRKDSINNLSSGVSKKAHRP